MTTTKTSKLSKYGLDLKAIADAVEPGKADTDCVWAACPKCNGQGRIAAYGHVESGICFECNGDKGKSVTVGQLRRRAKSRATAGAKYLLEQQREHAERIAAREAWETAHPELAALLRDETLYTDTRGRFFERDMAQRFFSHGQALTDAQTATLAAILTRRAETEAAKAEVAPLLAGAQVVQGKVLSVRESSNAWGTTTRITIGLDGGQRVNGTVPAELGWKSGAFVGVGDTVTFTATIEPSTDDATFGFYKRPRTASFVTRAELTDD